MTLLSCVIHRFFWFIAILTSFSIMSYFLFDIGRNNENFTIEVVDTGLPIHKIPFPAITICSETKSRKSMVNVTQAYHNLHYNFDDNTYSEEE